MSKLVGGVGGVLATTETMNEFDALSTLKSLESEQLYTEECHSSLHSMTGNTCLIHRCSRAGDVAPITSLHQNLPDIRFEVTART